MTFVTDSLQQHMPPRERLNLKPIYLSCSNWFAFDRNLCLAGAACSTRSRHRLLLPSPRKCSLHSLSICGQLLMMQVRTATERNSNGKRNKQKDARVSYACETVGHRAPNDHPTERSVDSRPPQNEADSALLHWPTPEIRFGDRAEA